MELLAQLDGFEGLGAVKIIMATNRPDMLDAALMRPGRLDRKIEIPLPNDAGRLEILKIHAGPISRKGEIDWDAIVKLSEGFNGADMRNVCTEAGMFAIREDRDYVVEDDFMKVRAPPPPPPPPPPPLPPPPLSPPAPPPPLYPPSPTLSNTLPASSKRISACSVTSRLAY